MKPKHTPELYDQWDKFLMPAVMGHFQVDDARELIRLARIGLAIDGVEDPAKLRAEHVEMLKVLYNCKACIETNAELMRQNPNSYHAFNQAVELIARIENRGDGK